MLTLVRNPMLKLASRYWWIAVVVLLALLGLSLERGRMFINSVIAIGIVFVAAIIAALTYGIIAYWRHKNEEGRFEWRFLCPHCLRFGDFRFACGGCGTRLDNFPIHADGEYVNDCPKCEAALIAGRIWNRPGISALCTRCGNCYDHTIYHQRSVRVVGTFYTDDFLRLSQTIGAVEGSSDKIIHSFHDDGHRLTYILHIPEILNKAANFSRSHVLLNVDTIWIDRAADSPLNLARDLDRYMNHMERAQNRRTPLAGCVRPLSLDTTTRVLFHLERAQNRQTPPAVCVRQPALDTAARSRFDALFHSVTYGMAARDVIAGNSGLWDEPRAATHVPENRMGERDILDRIVGQLD